MIRSSLVLVALVLVGCDGLSSTKLTREHAPEDEDAVPEHPIAPGKAQLRLLNAREYHDTVRSLLGVEASTSLALGDAAQGYDTGAGAKLDENTLSALVVEAERVAALYAQTRLRDDFPCYDPSAVSDTCVSSIVTRLGMRAWRRPLGADEAQALHEDFEGYATTTASRAAATEFLIARLLVSPNFLYRSEVGRPGAGARELDQYERASLLSYAVTGTMPDEALLDDAANGRLEGPRLREQVRRLLRTPAGKARFATFIEQWVRAGSLEEMSADRARFPKLGDDEVGPALRAELFRYVESVVFDGQGTLPALFGGSHTYVNRYTAPLYGLSVDSDGLQRVALDPTQRKGLLTLASVMTAHGSVGDASKDRPVKRGLLVVNRLLCGEIGPPSGINTAMAASNAAANLPNFDSLTVREQFEAMMEQGQECRSCHQQFMPLGFAFGNYDGLGRHVTQRLGRPIDAAVKDVPFGEEKKSFAGALPLVDALAASPLTARCLARNYVTWTTGASGGAHFERFSEDLAEELALDGNDLRRMVEDALASPHLYVRRAAPEDQP